MCEAVEMSAAYVYATRDDPVEHTVTDVERVKVDNGVIVFRGRKKRTLLVMNEHTLWRPGAQIRCAWIPAANVPSPLR